MGLTHCWLVALVLSSQTEGAGAPPASASPTPPVESAPATPVPEEAAAAAAAGAPSPSRTSDASANEASTLDIRVRRVTDALVAGLRKQGGDVRARKLAVLPFTDVGGKAKSAQLGLVTSEAVAVNLRKDHNLFVVERSRLGEVLSEQALAQSGVVDVKDTAKMGVMLDADVVVVGQVAEAGSDFLLTARIVDVQSTQVITSADARLPARELMTLSAESVVLRSRSDAAFRSAVVPGWGQSYNRQPLKSAIFIVATAVSVVASLAALATMGGLIVYYQTCTADCQEGKGRRFGPLPPVTFLNFGNLTVLIPQAGLVAALFLGLGVATWAVNVLDAYVSGVDG
ncbi:MAG: FlgO family outer membrane protein [Myxococcota bacterium]